MGWFVWVMEILAGTTLLWWGRPKVQAILYSLRPEKRDLELPKNDAVVARWWILGRGAGLVLGAIISAILLYKQVSLAFVGMLFLGLGEYFAEFLGQQSISKGHPWRVAVEDMSERLGISPGEVHYRQGDQWAPYATIGGVVLPSRALRELDYASLRFAVAGALITRQRRREWMQFAGWVLVGLLPLLYFSIKSPVSTGGQMFYNAMSTFLALFWVNYIPVRVCSRDNTIMDRLALIHTGDFDAAYKAIHVMDTPENASKRLLKLRVWWDKYQAEQAVATGATVTTQPTTQIQTLGRKP